jgi:hypothetical protein
MIDITKILKKYHNKWIALTDDDKVICAGRTLDEVMRKAKSKGYNEPVTMRVPDPRLEFVMKPIYS